MAQVSPSDAQKGIEAGREWAARGESQNFKLYNARLLSDLTARKSFRTLTPMNSFKSSAWWLSLAAYCSSPILSTAEVNQAGQVAPDVYFHEGDMKGSGHCNNGWIVFEDHVLVVDGNFPSGTEEIIPKIKTVTDKPIRFAFDTHHHGDHAYGNQIWVDNGAGQIRFTTAR